MRHETAMMSRMRNEFGANWTSKIVICSSGVVDETWERELKRQAQLWGDLNQCPAGELWWSDCP